MTTRRRAGKGAIELGALVLACNDLAGAVPLTLDFLEKNGIAILGDSRKRDGRSADHRNHWNSGSGKNSVQHDAPKELAQAGPDSPGECRTMVNASFVLVWLSAEKV